MGMQRAAGAGPVVAGTRQPTSAKDAQWRTVAHTARGDARVMGSWLPSILQRTGGGHGELAPSSLGTCTYMCFDYWSMGVKSGLVMLWLSN